MRYLFFILLILTPHHLLAQKEDYNWVLGDISYPDSLFSTAIMNFNAQPVSIEYVDVKMGFDIVSSSLSDSTGQLVCITNGISVYNNNYHAVENGEELQPFSQFPVGYGATQGVVLLPLKGKKYILVTGEIRVYSTNTGSLDGGFYPVYSYTINFSENSSGVLTEKQIPILNDTINFHGLSAVRHANGRDWWMVLNKNHTNTYYKILINDSHSSINSVQTLGSNIRPGWDHTVFSPDGKWYIRYSWWGTTSDPHSSIYLYNFDRCSGNLSNFQQYELKDNGPGGVAVSPNSRYLYVSNWDTILQYDLAANNIFESETVVASYDGFHAEDGLPARFFTPQLAPDGRIYLCVPNVSSRYLHYIEQPDSAGLACKVVQHGIKLPVYNSNTLPNLPYFRLYEEKGSPCDTIWKGELSDFGNIKVLPNPGSDRIILSMKSDGLPQSGIFRLYTATGNLVHQVRIPLKLQTFEMDISHLSNGMFFYELIMEDEQIARGKWIKSE